jgi:hypothetical protein
MSAAAFEGKSKKVKGKRRHAAFALSCCPFSILV